MKLTKYEQETIINFNNDEQDLQDTKDKNAKNDTK